jgi:hypothetical protein
MISFIPSNDGMIWCRPEIRFPSFEAENRILYDRFFKGLAADSVDPLFPGSIKADAEIIHERTEDFLAAVLAFAL